METNRFDYRLLPAETKSDLLSRLAAVKNVIDSKHSITNYYSFLQDKKNNDTLKLFSDIFLERCCYCGDSFPIAINYGNLEIDHIFSKSIQENNIITNLAPACHNCNSGKKAIVMSKEQADLINPYNSIHNIFFRDDNLYIKISEKYIHEKFVNLFYKKLGLGRELHRLTYIILVLDKLKEKCDNRDIKSKIGNCISILQKSVNNTIRML